MIPKVPVGATHIIRSEGMVSLPVEKRDNAYISVWEPTPAEVEHIKHGGLIRLVILAKEHPPVQVVALPPLLDLSTPFPLSMPDK